MAQKIDHLDQAIIKLLSEDGRMPSAEIARRIGGLTERAVRYRIKRLIQEGFIKIKAIANPKALGYPVTADISLEVEPGHVDEVARQIATFGCVSYVAFSIGERDISVQVNMRDNDELYYFVTEVLGNLPGMKKITTILVPQKLKDVYDWNPSSCDKSE